MKDAQFPNRKKINSPARSPWRCAYVNEQGEEVEITEHMIQRACSRLERELDNHLLLTKTEKKGNQICR